MAKFNVDGIQNVEVSKKLPPQMSPSEQLALMQRYTDTHRACADLSKGEREIRCLQVLYPALLRRMERYIELNPGFRKISIQFDYQI